jgi:hypothetical protein
MNVLPPQVRFLNRAADVNSSSAHTSTNWELPMSSLWFTRLLLTTTAGALLWSGSALADPADRVARISFIGGKVSFRPASLDEWSVATVNYPLTVGDHVWTDRGARTELQLGSTVVRIAPLTEFSVLNLDDRTAQLRVTQGSISVRVRTMTDRDLVEIDTPNGAMTVARAGLYRADVNEAGDASTVTIREGQANVATATAAFSLTRDQSVILTGFDAAQADVRGAVGISELEDWSLTRDRRTDSLEAARYVSAEMIGYEDLDANGHWQTVAAYGPVWMPRVRAEWVPYRYGHWAWIEPWGWTWIDEAAWGFAPFHYGRWVYLPARGWAWVPGPMAVRPVYAPALVAFVGGPGWAVSARLGAAPVGWFPLGPREPYLPAYRVTPEYVRRVNAASVTNINVTTINVTTITYVNRSVPGAVTAVPRDAFARARPVAAVAVAVPGEQAQAAPVTAVAAVVPQRDSLAGTPHRTATPPAAAVSRQVVVRSAPPPPPAPFAENEAMLAQHPGQPLGLSATPVNGAQPAPSASTPHPLVRAVTAPQPPASAPRSAAAPRPPESQLSQTPTPSPTTKPAPAASPSLPAARGASSPAMAELAARHTRERADLDARHTQERATLQTRHEQERQATKPADRAQLQQRHQQETKALQDRLQQERAALQKRHQEERQNQKQGT